VLTQISSSASPPIPACHPVGATGTASTTRAPPSRTAIDGLEHLRAAAPYVVVSNHQSNLDPIVHLRALPLSRRVLARHDLFRIWVFGPALRMIG
jgi:1-acyl-sn-glycerol-3-phosphate acyltransferase